MNSSNIRNKINVKSKLNFDMSKVLGSLSFHNIRLGLLFKSKVNEEQLLLIASNLAQIYNYASTFYNLDWSFSVIVNHLPTLLAERRLKVADAVRATGISKTTLHKIYNDQSSRIDFDTIDKLCEFLEVEVGDIFEYVASSDAENVQALDSKKN